jgi:two-component system sensor histidine kinase UhpB
MYDLQHLIGRVQDGELEIHPSMLQNPDPNINQLASALNTLINELEDRNRQLQALSKRVINAQEEERKRIARNLHDETGQSLTMLIVRLENMLDKLPSGQIEVSKRLITARDLAAQTLQDLRTTVSGLRPTILDDLGLIPALRWYARNHLENAGIAVKLHVPDENPPLHPEQSTALFRIAQEAINNIIRHADATTAAISLVTNQGTICLEVKDNGQGFPVLSGSKTDFLPDQLGLIGIRERAELIGGYLEINSAPNQGTSIKVCVPKGDLSDG